MKKQSRQSAFTLIELAIVIIIIGFLVGGVVVGRSMIKSSEIQALAAESARFTQAINNFQDKYKALPGDFSGATSIWGAANGTPSVCITTVGTGKATCNGDGNGRIVTLTGGNYATTYYEQFRAWQHMSNAGFVTGSYSGVSTSGTYNYTIGTNIPSSSYSGGGWKVLNYTVRDQLSGIDATYPYVEGDIPPNLMLWFGGKYLSDSLEMSGIISGIDARDLDSKIDDGKAHTGKMVAQKSSGDCAAGGDYLTTSAALCALAFKTGQ